MQAPISAYIPASGSLNGQTRLPTARSTAASSTTPCYSRCPSVCSQSHDPPQHHPWHELSLKPEGRFDSEQVVVDVEVGDGALVIASGEAVATEER